MSLFGTPTAFSAATPSMFGAPAGGGASAPSPFGAPASTPSLFGASAPAASTPAFGQAGGGFFGASQAPAASSTPSLFGASQPPASTHSLFGASQPPASTPSLFGASQPPASTPSLFGAAATPGATSQPGGGLFGGGASTPSMFGPSTTPAGGAGAAATMAQGLFTKDQKLLTHSTKWDDIHPSSQQTLLKLEETIVAYRDQCRQLDQDGRLSDNTMLKRSMAEETKLMSQSLQALMNVVKADNNGLIALKEKVMTLLRDTEAATRTFSRTQLARQISRQLAAGQVLPPGIQDQIGAPPVLPSPYFREAVTGLEEVLSQYMGSVHELQALLPLDGDGLLVEESALASLQSSLNNTHDYFVHVAAKVEAFHSSTQAAKEAFLMSRRQAGDLHDPFEEASRREAARERAAAERAKARISAAAAQQAATPPASAAGQLALLSAGTTPGASTPSLFGTPQTPAPVSAAAAGGGLFGAATPAPSAAPTPSLFGAAAPAASPFSSTGGGGGLFGGGAAASPSTPFGTTPAFGQQPTGSGGGLTRTKSKNRRK